MFKDNTTPDRKRKKKLESFEVFLPCQSLFFSVLVIDKSCSEKQVEKCDHYIYIILYYIILYYIILYYIILFVLFMS